MKKLLTLTILALAMGFIGAIEISAQKVVINKSGKTNSAGNTQTRRAKDLFTQYDESNPSGGGAAGAKVSVLLKRGNERERIVSTNETFYTGDKIKLVFDINFSGYAGIINIGPTGNESILFPYIEGNRMVDHSIAPNAALQLPRGNAWINFGGSKGDEQVTVIFSKTPIAEMEGYEEAVTPGSDGRVASESEADAILAELNSKSLGRRKSKDLFTQTESDGTYAVSQGGLGNEPIAFSFVLKHR